MSNETLELRIESLENQIHKLTEKLSKKEMEIHELKDIEEIKKLQAAYAYYLENSMSQDIIDCFSNDPGISGTFIEGTYKGPEGIKRYFNRIREKAPTFLHQVRMDTPHIDDEMAPENMKLSPDEWAEYDTQYPSGYILPFHFHHPVTGKPTSENEYNARLDLKPNPFRPREQK